MRNVRSVTALTITRGLSIYYLLYGSLISRSLLLRSALSLSLPSTSLYYPARLPQCLLSVRGISALPLSCSLSLPLLLSRLRPLSSPAVPIHLSGGTTTLRARYISSLSLYPAPAAVRNRTFASAASRADRAPACLLTIPLPRVARPSSVCACVPLPRMRCHIRTRPGDASV